MSKLIRLLPISFFLVVLVSCLDMNTDREYLADAYVTSKVINGDTLFSIEAYVEASAPMSKVTMRFPSGQDVELVKITTGYFEYVAPESTFSPTIPNEAEYSFSILFEDSEVITASDLVTKKVLLPMNIKKLEEAVETSTISLDWAKDENANYYSIKIFKKNTIIYSSGLISFEYTGTKIDSYEKGWALHQNPEEGDTVMVVVSGLLKEEGNPQYLEFQSISNSDGKIIVWPK